MSRSEDHFSDHFLRTNKGDEFFSQLKVKLLDQPNEATQDDMLRFALLYLTNNHSGAHDLENRSVQLARDILTYQLVLMVSAGLVGIASLHVDISFCLPEHPEAMSPIDYEDNEEWSKMTDIARGITALLHDEALWVGPGNFVMVEL